MKQIHEHTLEQLHSFEPLIYIMRVLSQENGIKEKWTTLHEPEKGKRC